jgi:hypothetical protein
MELEPFAGMHWFALSVVTEFQYVSGVSGENTGETNAKTFSLNFKIRRPTLLFDIQRCSSPGG